MLHFTKLAISSCGNENKQQNPSKLCRPQSQKFEKHLPFDWRCITAWNHRLADVTGQEKEATAGKLRSNSSCRWATRMGDVGESGLASLRFQA